MARHKAITAAIVAFVGTGGALVYYQRNMSRKRRRARRAPSGARREIVVVAGPAGSPVTKSVMLDLEKRGFIVYVVAHTLEEEDLIKAEGVGRTDIRPFLINIADVCLICWGWLGSEGMLTIICSPLRLRKRCSASKRCCRRDIRPSRALHLTTSPSLSCVLLLRNL